LETFSQSFLPHSEMFSVYFTEVFLGVSLYHSPGDSCTFILSLVLWTLDHFVLSLGLFPCICGAYFPIASSTRMLGRIDIWRTWIYKNFNP
jgi:hypothetical protein